MTRLGVHKHWGPKFLQREIDIRVPRYAKLDPERRAAFESIHAEEAARITRYAFGDPTKDELDLRYGTRGLEQTGRQRLREGLANLLGRRNGADMLQIHKGAWEMLLRHLLWAGWWRCTKGLPPRAARGCPKFCV